MTILHLRQLSQIIQESPGYRTNLPVSHTVCQISRIKVNLDITFIKDKKSSKFDLQIKKYWFPFHGMLYFCEILLDFGKYVYPF